MKRLTYLLIFVASLGYSQSNLVFSRVLNFNLGFQENVTVPEGKVWKVEEFYNTGNTLNALYFSNPSPELGNPVSNSFYAFSDRPVWFEEGVILRGNGQVISVLEFDVVPVSTTSTGSGGLSSEGLEFNQVINYSNNVIVGGFGEIIDVLEVPQGKVWKITRVTILGRSSGTAPGTQYRPNDVDQISVELGGINLFYRPTNSGYSNSSFENYPVWINSGTKDLVVGKYASDSSSFRITLSAIEYNIPQ